MSQRRPTHMYCCLRNSILSTALYYVRQRMATFCHLLQLSLNATFINCLQHSVAYYYVLTTVSRKSVLAVSYNWNEPRMVKYIMVMFAFIYDYIPLFGYISHFCYYMCLYLSLFCKIYHYLAILSLIWQHLTYRVISTPVGHIYPYCGNVPTLCVLLLKLLEEQLDNYFWSYCIFKNEDTKV